MWRPSHHGSHRLLERMIPRARGAWVRLAGERSTLRAPTISRRFTSSGHVMLIKRRRALERRDDPGAKCVTRWKRVNEVWKRCRTNWNGKVDRISRTGIERTRDEVGTTCHARRELFVPKLQYFSQFSVYLSKTEQAKQIINSLVLNHFYSVMSYPVRRRKKRWIIVYGLVNRYGPQSVAW